MSFVLLLYIFNPGGLGGWTSKTAQVQSHHLRHSASLSITRRLGPNSSFISSKIKPDCLMVLAGSADEQLEHYSRNCMYWGLIRKGHAVGT